MLNEEDDRELGRRQQEKLWYDSTKNPLSLGCHGCDDQEICGGLRIAHPTYNCLDFCCGDAEDCDMVCLNNPKVFVECWREVKGFELSNVPRAAPIICSSLPSAVPFVDHKYTLESGFSPRACALSLFGVAKEIDDFFEPSDVLAMYGIKEGTPLILNGVAPDPEIEQKWWKLTSPRRKEIIGKLAELNVRLVTTPNYSVFSDVPRWDNLHSMKRIAVAHTEFLRGGLPAALHVNARTDRDWERWTDYVQTRPEVTHVAFEFRTGGRWADRLRWQINHLVQFAQTVGRSLRLVVRGLGPSKQHAFAKLLPVFKELTVLDTHAFHNTVRWQRITCTDLRRNTLDSDTDNTADRDELMSFNWDVLRTCYVRAFHQASTSREAFG